MLLLCFDRLKDPHPALEAFDVRGFFLLSGGKLSHVNFVL